MTFLSEILKEDFNGGDHQSFNDTYKDYFLKSDYLVVIVGTITPLREQDNGFYYSGGSPFNHMYKMLDKYFNGSTNFRELSRSKDFETLKRLLIEKRIIFLDTISSCCNEKESPKDDDLTSIKLDYETFKGIKSNALLIADSRNAYYSLLKIAFKNKLKNEVVFCPIFRNAYNQEEWEKVLSKGGIEK